MVKQSLKDYALAHPYVPGRPCSVCALPPDVVKEINRAATDRQISYTTIAEWLTKVHGVKDMNRKRIEHHIKQRHHERS